MSASYWIKLYHEILDDPKMATLPDRLWRRVVELFLCAGRLNQNGHLPDTKQLAWMMRMSTDDLDLDLKQIASTGIIQRNDNGWLVTKFEERQAAVSGNERVRQFRERQKKQQYYGDVTQMKRDVTQIRSDTDQIRSEEEGAATPAIFSDHQERRAERLYQKITGQATIPSDYYAKAIHDLIAILDHYPGQEPPPAEGRAVFVRWCSTTGQKGKTYSRTNPGWIGWWLEELAPIPLEAREQDISKMTSEEFHAYMAERARLREQNSNTLPSEEG